MDIEHVLECLEQAAPLRLITTPRMALVTCSVSDELYRVLDRPEHAHFDDLPVCAGDAIIGLLPRSRLAREGVAGGMTVEAAMCPLDERRLMSGDTPLLSYLVQADAQPTRLVVDHDRITGIVTLADLQKLPVRPILFLLVTHVELLIAAVLRQLFPSPHRCLDLLTPCRRERIEAKWAELEVADMAADQIGAMEFCDKRDALLRSVPVDLGRHRAERELKLIETLRNSVAHAGAYARNPANALNVIRAAKLARCWIDRLERLRRDAGRHGRAA